MDPSDRPHALIIEDELIIALGLQAQLSELGYRSFAFAGTERQALEQALLKCPDLVTVDVGLLDGSGLAAADAILAACGPLPVVYVTGDAAAACGRPGLVEKPVSDQALAAAIIAARADAPEPELSRSGRSHSPGSGPRPDW